MPENGMIIQAINFEDHLDDEVEYHFNVDVQVLIDRKNNKASIGWCELGSEVSKLWRKDAGYG